LLLWGWKSFGKIRGGGVCGDGDGDGDGWRLRGGKENRSIRLTVGLLLITYSRWRNRSAMSLPLDGIEIRYIKTCRAKSITLGKESVTKIKSINHQA